MTCQKTVLMVLPDRRDRADGDDGDERRKQSVLEQILAVFRAAELRDSPQHGDGYR